ncbi:hypothetical protein K438DRAFT_1987237 [Mycena galopus ATCC 62051]|nr:hypothetical protein K438DRAFT_1987237 [Mycena galopus ATCC 62051]
MISCNRHDAFPTCQMPLDVDNGTHGAAARHVRRAPDVFISHFTAAAGPDVDNASKPNLSEFENHKIPQGEKPSIWYIPLVGPESIGYKYDNFSFNLPVFEDCPEHDWAWKRKDIAAYVQDAAWRTAEIMSVEGRLIALALENLEYGSFEADWAALNKGKKKEIVLEGLYRGACAAPRDNSRVSCPEMTIAGLVGDGEYNLINLPKRIVAHDPTGNGRVKGLYLFIHPYVDHEMRHTEDAPDHLKCYMYGVALLRNYYIVETLYGILQAYHGRAPQVVTITRLHGKRQYRGLTEEEQKFGAQLNIDDSQCKEEAALAVHACYTCREKTGRDNLKYCARCKGVWYCSKECQRADWKNHKKYCGQPRFDPKIFAPEVEEPDSLIGCPTVASGFTRSPTLWRQVGWLAKSDSQTRDYHVMPNMDPVHTRSIRIFCPYARKFFLIARRRAMASGSLPAIYTMLEIIESQIEDCNLTMDQVRNQFELEYGLKLPTSPAAIRAVAKDFERPTTQELDEELLYDKRRQASVPVPEEHLEQLEFRP